MDIFSLLSYVNKVSLLAFFVTTLVVGYQVYVLKKEKTKEQTPTIPDFKEKNNLNKITNFTSLPSSLTKKELQKVSYSKLIFLIISLLTIMVVIFVLILIKKNNSVRNEALVSPSIIVLPTPTFKPACVGQACLTPTKTPIIKPTMVLSPTVILLPSPTSALLVSPTAALSPSPTEIILAKTSTCTDQACPTPTQEITNTNSKLQTLPETGNLGKGLFIFGVAISTIFFSFWF